MQINISTRHGHLSAETQEKLSEKLAKLSRFHERISAVNATVDLEHPDSPLVELRVSVERAGEFVATDRSDVLVGALDAAIHKLEQQLRKHKEKITDRRHAGPKAPRGAEPQEREGDVQPR